MHPNFIVGTVADPVVIVNTATVTNINLTYVPDVAFTSGNTNILAVLPNGQIEAVGPGTTTLRAAYQGISNQTSVTVMAAPAQPLLTHRYSFTSDASDSVSGENGTLMGGAVITSGSLDLTANGPSGQGNGTSGSYLALPRDVITGYPAATVEMWATLGINPVANGRLFDVGSWFADGGDSSAFVLSPTWDGTSTALVLNPQLSILTGFPNATLAGVPLQNATNNQETSFAEPLASLGTVQIVGVATPSGLSLYANGILASFSSNSDSLLSVSNQFVSIGQSFGLTWNDDSSDYNPDINGTIDEVRLYYGALPPAQIAADAMAGPNSTNGTPGALETVSASIPSTIPLGTVAHATVLATYANVGAVNVSTAATYASSNAAIISVTGGQLTGLELGSTTISVTYGGSNFTQLVSVVPLYTALMDRYSFIANANDSVGTNDGTLQGTASIASGGGLSLDGGGWVSLPAGTISANYYALTYELWANVQRTVDGAPTVIAYFGNSGAAARMVTKANETRCWTEYYDGLGQDARVEPPGPIAGSVHLVAIFDPAAGYMTFYKDGILLNSNTITGLLSPISGASDAENLIGANDGGSIPITGTINEFRIYNGALTIDQIRASIAAGPANVPLINGTINPGAITSVSVSMHPNFIVGTVADPVVIANTATVSNINLTCVPSVSFTSGDTNILVVLPNGQVQAVGAGTTRLTATYQGINGQTSVTTLPVPAQSLLTHRYSFASDASDSISGENGILMGGAVIDSGGGLDLTGNNESGVDGVGTSGAYLGLPRDVITGYPAVTVEFWANVGIDSGSSRLFNVGDYGNPVTISTTVSLAGGDTSVFGLSPSYDGTGTAVFLDPTNAQVAPFQEAETAVLLDSLTQPVQVVGVVTPATLSLYTNGELAAVSPTTYSLLAVTNQFASIGQSFALDGPFANGIVSEARLYYGALPPAQIAADYKAGLSSTNGAPGALETVSAFIPSTIALNMVTNATVTATYANVGAVNVTAAATYASSNTALISVTGGQLTGLELGSTTISVTYGGSNFTKLVTVLPPLPAVLMDRYSFIADASDSVGTNDGTFQGDASIATGGGLSLPDQAGWVSLPAGTITPAFTALTIEIFADVQRTSDGGNPTVIAFFGNGTYFSRIITKANALNCWMGYGTPGHGTDSESRIWPPGPIAGNVHLVGVWNPERQSLLFYKNGILMGSNTMPAGFPMGNLAGANDTANAIGANSGGGVPIAGTIYEVRIYNGELTIDQIRASIAAGPANIPLINGTINPGAITSVSVSVHPNFIVGTVADPVVVANTATVTNINLTYVPDVAFTSGNTNILAVLPNGQIQAVGAGTTTLTATYQGISNQTSVTVMAAPAQALLTHEYSFTSDASDSVSGENGTLMGGAVITSNSLDLTGNGASGPAGQGGKGQVGTSGAYLALPRDVITGYPAATVEMWATLENTAANSRLFDVGSWFADGGDSSAFVLSPNWEGNATALVLNPQLPILTGFPNATLAGVPLQSATNNQETFFYGPLASLGAVQIQIVGVATPSGLSLYTNGILASFSPNSDSLLSVSNQFVSIGQSFGLTWNDDSSDYNPDINGTIDEVRLYYGALSAAQIAADAKLGPGSVVPTLTAAVSGQSVIISWPAPSTGFTLQSSPALGGAGENWQPVSGQTQVGAYWTLSVSLSGSGNARFFRLVN
jgi:hypothetical protein